jgi:uncharacterized membrane protein
VSKDRCWSGQKGWVIAIVILGIFFRFINLDRKIFWEDESFTALRISGYTHQEVVENLYVTGQSVTFAEIQKYLSPNSDKGIQDMIHGLAIEDPHVPVLYFVLVRCWAQCFGGSIAILRSLSAVFGVLCLPAFYWLCIELFRSRPIAGIGMALLAVSPFHVLYSQEARFYSLWTLTILISSALLLKSLRQSTPIYWLLYAASVAIGIYSHLFFIFIAFSHGIYVLVLERFRLTRSLITYFLASAVGLSTFMPWAIVLFDHRVQAAAMMQSAWRSVNFSLLSLMTMWTGNISRLFFDVGIGSQDSFQTILPVIPFLVGAIALALYSAHSFIWSSPLPARLFVIILTSVSMLFFLASDLFIGGRISGMPRYSLALFIGIQLAVASTLGTQLPYLSKRFGWKLLIGVLFSINVFSCAISIPEKIWWHKGPHTTRYIPQVAALINQMENPWVVTDLGFVNIPAIAHELNPDIRIQLVLKGTIPQLPPDRQILAFQPSSTLQQILQTQGKLTPIAHTGNTLYQLER